MKRWVGGWVGGRRETYPRVFHAERESGASFSLATKAAISASASLSDSGGKDWRERVGGWVGG